jgi:methylamine utilization protein MauJ
MGVPGIDGFVFTVEVRPHEGRDGGTASVDDAREREFRVVAALAKYAPFPSAISASIGDFEGGSYFVVPKNVTQVSVQGPCGTMRMFTNTAGELARVSQNCVATGWKDALRQFTRGLAPFLDHVSYAADVPVVIEKLYCHDPANGVHVASFKTPYGPAPLPVGALVVDALLPLYALYREAKNSSSNYYKLLCYQKILEGIYKSTRPTLRRKAKEQGIELQAEGEKVPAHPELADFDGTPVGRPIGQVYADLLTPKFRDAVAHFSLRDGTMLIISDYEWSSRFSAVVLLAEVCAREVIRSEEVAHLFFLHAGGKP